MYSTEVVPGPSLIYKHQRELEVENNSIAEQLENILQFIGWKITRVHMQS